MRGRRQSARHPPAQGKIVASDRGGQKTRGRAAHLRGARRAASRRRHRAALQGRLPAAGRHDPVGAVHRRARQPGDAGALQAISQRAGARAARPTAELEPQIQSTGFFRAKSKSLKGMATALVERHSGEVPATMEALVELPGVGRKTANVVLGHALGVPGLPVDRHVLRVANRIGIARSDDPVVVEQQLTSVLPPADWTRASDTLILHGRRICKPKPLCDRCAVTDRLRLLPPRRLEGTEFRRRGRRRRARSAPGREVCDNPRGVRTPRRGGAAGHSRPLPPRHAERGRRRRRRAVAGPARGNGGRARRYALRPLSGHAAAGAPAGATATPCRIASRSTRDRSRRPAPTTRRSATASPRPSSTSSATISG